MTRSEKTCLFMLGAFSFAKPTFPLFLVILMAALILIVFRRFGVFGKQKKERRVADAVS